MKQPTAGEVLEMAKQAGESPTVIWRDRSVFVGSSGSWVGLRGLSFELPSEAVLLASLLAYLINHGPRKE